MPLPLLIADAPVQQGLQHLSVDVMQLIEGFGLLLGTALAAYFARQAKKSANEASVTIAPQQTATVDRAAATIDRIAAQVDRMDSRLLNAEGRIDEAIRGDAHFLREYEARVDVVERKVEAIERRYPPDRRQLERDHPSDRRGRGGV